MKIGGEVSVFHEDIFPASGAVGDEGGEQSQNNGLHEVDAHILMIGQAALERAHEKNAHLAQAAGPPEPFLRPGGALGFTGDDSPAPVLEVALVPLPRRYAALPCVVSIFIDGLGLDDLEELLGIDIAAMGTGILSHACLVHRRSEIDDGIERIAVIDGPAALIQNPQGVEQLVDAR